MHHRRSSCFVFASLLCILCTFQTSLQGKRVNPRQAESWQPAGQLIEARALHTATLLADGRILVVGGRDANNAALNSAELYQPFAASRPTGSLNQARFGHTATLLLDGRVLVAGGTNNGTLVSAEIYDPATELWSPAADLGTSRADHTATLLLEGVVLVAGGCQDDQPNCSGGVVLNSAEIYDPKDDKWTFVESLNIARTSHTATRLADGGVLIAGGTKINRAEIFDPMKKHWTETDVAVNARSIHTATLLSDNRVVVAGGANPVSGSYDIASAEVFNPSDGTWTSTGNLTTGRGGHTALLLPNERVLVTGGRQDFFVVGGQIGVKGQNGTVLTSSEVFTPQEGTWSVAAANLSAARFNHTATLLPDNRVVVIGGENGAALASAEMLDVRPMVDLSISITDGLPSAASGQPITYTIEVNNAGLDPVKGAEVIDLFPPEFQFASWTCLASEGSVCTSGPVSGDIEDTVDLLPLGQLSYTVSGVFEAGESLELVNTASVQPPLGVVDPDSSNNSATDRDPLRLPFVVNSTDDLIDNQPGDGECFTGFDLNSGEPQCTLRAAIQEANALKGNDTIQLPNLSPAPGSPGLARLSTTYSLALQPGPQQRLEPRQGADDQSGDLDISDNLTIQGEGAQQVIISAQEIDRVFEITGLQSQVFREIQVEIRDLTIRDGKAPFSVGGGVRNLGARLSLVQVALIDNMAARGGAVDNSLGILSIDRSTLAGNRTESLVSDLLGNQDGGALFNLGTATIANSTISGNSAARGGGIWNETGGILTLTNSTIAFNQTDSAAQGFAGGLVNFGEATAQNTLFSDNSGGDCFGPLNSQGGNLDQDGSCQLRGGDLSATDPDLAPLGDNDGPTQTHALGVGSPAIDGGLEASCPASDQRGAPRLLDGDGLAGPSCDIGAYEAAPFQAAQTTVDLPALTDVDAPVLAYVMLGSPLQLADPSPLPILNEAIANLSPDVFRLFRGWDPVSREYQEFLLPDDSGGFFDFSQNRASWLISRFGGSVTFRGIPASAEGAPATIQVAPGFQQITSPFNFEMDWQCVVGRNLGSCPNEPGLTAINPCLVGYDGLIERGYVAAETMQPGLGYWVFNQCQEPVDLVVPPICAAAQGQAREPLCPPDLQAQGLLVELSVEANGLRDSGNFLGTDPRALDERDPLDHPEPPPFHGVSLSFPHPEWDALWPDFCSDIRAPMAPGIAWPMAWDFEVRVAYPNTLVRLEWRRMGRSVQGLVLKDTESGRVVDMGAVSTYSYPSGPGGTRRFEVIPR